MKKFEVPYNFDSSLIDQIKQNNLEEYVDFIYSAPFFDDHDGAKKNYNEGTDNNTKSWRSLDRKSYEALVRIIPENGFKLAILLQNPKHYVSDDLIHYYIGLGATVFVVSQDDIAKRIKAINPSIEVVASIAKKLSLFEIMENDISMYDRIVLHFPYNRALDALKMLPKQYKYVMLVNCACGYTCPGTHHWFAKADANGRELSNRALCTSQDCKESITVLPQDLELFDNYVESYKLQGREYLTEMIIEDLLDYSKRNARHYSKFNLYINEHYGNDRHKYYNVANHFVLTKDKF